MEISTIAPMLTLTPAKTKEWREWGKGAYKSAQKMMTGNIRHPNYDTLEKREACHDVNESGTGEYSYQLSESGKERLKTKFGYSDEAIDEARAAWIDGYKASRVWYKREDAKQQAIIDQYGAIWRAAEAVAAAVDVSGLKDGFPCGAAHLYLDKYAEHEQLRKAIGHFNGDSSTDAYKYELKMIQMPAHHHQCIVFDETYCRAVQAFLRTKGVFASVNTWID